MTHDLSLEESKNCHITSCHQKSRSLPRIVLGIVVEGILLRFDQISLGLILFLRIKGAAIDVNSCG